LIAGSNESLNTGNCKTVDRGEDASSDGIARISSAGSVVITSNVGVDATTRSNARVNCANVEVIAISSVKGNMEATINNITVILGAAVAIIARHSGVSAISSNHIATIGSAGIGIIAILGS